MPEPRTRPSHRVAIYLRQSKDAEDTGLAVARQLDACKALCAARGWTVAEVFTDNNLSASGRVKRPEFDRMMSLAGQGKFDVIVAYHLDRLTRSMADLERLIKDAESGGYTIVTASGDIDLSTDAGQLVARILGSVAVGEIRRKGRRQRDAGAQRAAMGLPHTGGFRAFGYSDDGMKINPTEAVAVRRVYKQILAGMSLSAIGRELTEDGFRTSRGYPWRFTSVRELIINPRYAGLRSYKGEIVGTAAWPGIVGEDVWRSAVAIVTDPSRLKHSNGTARKWLLTGLALCGVCNDGTKVVSHNYYGKKTTYRIYKCSASSHLYRKAEPIDDFAERLVIGWVSRPEAAEILVADDLPNIEELRTEAMALRQRKMQIAEEFALDPNITPSQLRIMNDRVSTRLAEIEAEMISHDRAPALAELISSVDPKGTWKALDLSAQRAALSAICTLTINKGKPGPRSFDARTIVPTWA